MTEAQKIKLAFYETQFKENLAKYSSWGSDEACSFGIYVSESPEDKNLTLIITTITGLSDDYQPYTATNNIMVEPNGDSLKLTDIYPKEYVLEYIKKLKKIN